MSVLPYHTTRSQIMLPIKTSTDKMSSSSLGFTNISMPQSTKLPFFHSLPDAPKRLVDSVKANMSYEDKALNMKAWLYFIGDDSVYGYDIGRRIQFKEIDIRVNEKSGAEEAVVVFGIKVEKGGVSCLDNCIDYRD